MQLTKTFFILFMGMTVASALALPPQAQADDLVVRAEAATNAAAADKDKDKDKKKAAADDKDKKKKAAADDKDKKKKAAADDKDKKKKNGNADKTTKKGTQNKAQDCSKAKKLASGIDKNIEIQKTEQSDVFAIEKIVSSDNVDKKDFEKAKKTLLKTIEDGMKVRAQNQELAKGNGAAAGLDKVKTAQAKELKQAEGLQGTRRDMSTIEELKREFSGGIEQNQKNKQAALKGC